MKRRHWLILAFALVVACAAIVAVVFAVQRTQGKLVSSVTTPGSGHLKVALRDSRGGDHTSWLVLHDAPEGGDRKLLKLFGAGDAGGDGWVGMSGDLRLPAGVYRYGVYSADRLYAPDDPQYWTPEYLVAEGQVTVR